MTELYVAWQDAQSRRWFPIGKLSTSEKGYEFAYTRGVLEAKKHAGFEGLQSFVGLNQTYFSDDLFPLFSNRVLPRSRKDYDDFIHYLNLPSETSNAIDVLARSGGQKETDKLYIFPLPEKDNLGNYIVHFFANGIRYIPSDSHAIIEKLTVGTSLELIPEENNAYDSFALQLRGCGAKLGYCPRYLNEDFNFLLKHASATVTVEKVNPSPAPSQLRLLCKFVSDWPVGFTPFAGESFQPIVGLTLVK